MKKHIILAILLAWSTLAIAADNFTIWDSQSFTGPFADGVVAESTPISNTSGNNAIKVWIKYSGITHSGSNSNLCPCDIRAVLEEEIATGKWIPIANQFQEFSVLDSGNERILVLSPALQLSPGNDEIIEQATGSDIRISRTQGSAPTSFRLKVIVRGSDPQSLTAITLDANGRKYNE